MSSCLFENQEKIQLFKKSYILKKTDSEKFHDVKFTVPTLNATLSYGSVTCISPPQSLALITTST
jgi:hypothetical protein